MKTPRTDAARIDGSHFGRDDGPTGYVFASFAEQLETELAAHSAQPTTRDRDVQELQDERLETAALRSQNAELVEALRKVDGTCTVDYLNPCWNGRKTDVIGKHWGGGEACACCHSRALLARVESR